MLWCMFFWTSHYKNSEIKWYIIFDTSGALCFIMVSFSLYCCHRNMYNYLLDSSMFPPTYTHFIKLITHRYYIIKYDPAGFVAAKKLFRNHRWYCFFFLSFYALYFTILKYCMNTNFLSNIKHITKVIVGCWNCLLHILVRYLFALVENTFFSPPNSPTLCKTLWCEDPFVGGLKISITLTQIIIP